MRRLILAAAGAALAAGFAPPKPVSRITRLHDTDDEDAADLAFLGRAMKAKSKKNAAPLAGFDPLAALKRFGQGLDDFVDDAMDRKLGNGAEFYGKRKSNFYGADDPMKTDGRGGDQYKGPVGGGYFKRDAEGRPVTRKGTPIGWDKE
jgi:hypothetical protein